jgi:Zn-dependent protease with chaperone function
MMDRARFDALVEAIERRFEGRPEALARHTGRWLLLGYALIGSLTILLAGAGLSLFVAGILLPGVGVVLIVAGVALIIAGLAHFWALMITDMDAPKGRTILPTEAKELHALVDLLRENLDVPVLDGILVTNDFNASIIQHSRFGIFGWSRHWLIVGLPLMLATSPPELASVLAHECGHLSRKHGHDSNRIYRMHRAWQQLFESVQKNVSHGTVRFAGKILFRFVEWYWPRFHARAFLLSRSNEFQADRISAESTSAEHAASALWRIECTAHYLENDFWKELWNLAESQPEPPRDLCDRMRLAFREAPESAHAARWCDMSLKRVISQEDSHPSFANRVSAMGLQAEDLHRRGFPVAPQQTAADRLLGDEVESFENFVNEEWRSSVQATWRDRYRRIMTVRKLTSGLTETANPSSLSAAEVWAQARRIADVQGLEAAAPTLRKVLMLQPDHVGATFAVGQLHLMNGQAEGEDLLAYVMGLQNREWSLPAGQLLEKHFTSTGRKSEARDVRRQLDIFEKHQSEAEKERSDVGRSDVFTAHGLTPVELKQISSVLLKQQSCTAAWLARKMLKYFPDDPLFVLAVDSKKKNGESRADQNNRMITSLMLQLELPGRLFVVTPTGEFSGAAARLSRVPEWKIFDRDETQPSF